MAILLRVMDFFIRAVRNSFDRMGGFLKFCGNFYGLFSFRIRLLGTGALGFGFSQRLLFLRLGWAVFGNGMRSYLGRVGHTQARSSLCGPQNSKSQGN